MGKFRYIFNISFIAVLTCLVFSCSEDDNLEISGDECSVVVKGFSFNNEALGGGVTDIERMPDTPEAVGGYKVLVENLDDNTVPDINEEFNFVASGGEAYGVIDKVTKGNNRFTAESIRNTALFEDNPEVGEYFSDGWNNLWGTVVESTYYYDNQRRDDYKDILEDFLPCYTIYRSEVDFNVIAGAENVIPFQMTAVNGRILVVIENNSGYDATVTYNGRSENFYQSGYTGKAIFILLNDDSESNKNVNIDIKYTKIKNNGRIQIKNKTVKLKLEPGKNKTQLINIHN